MESTGKPLVELTAHLYPGTVEPPDSLRYCFRDPGPVGTAAVAEEIRRDHQHCAAPVCLPKQRLLEAAGGYEMIGLAPVEPATTPTGRRAVAQIDEARAILAKDRAGESPGGERIARSESALADAESRRDAAFLRNRPRAGRVTTAMITAFGLTPERAWQLLCAEHTVNIWERNARYAQGSNWHLLGPEHADDRWRLAGGPRFRLWWRSAVGIATISVSGDDAGLRLTFLGLGREPIFPAVDPRLREVRGYDLTELKAVAAARFDDMAGRR